MYFDTLNASHLYEWNYLRIHTKHYKHIFHFYQNAQCRLYEIVCFQSLQAPDVPFCMIFTAVLCVYGPSINKIILSMNLIPDCYKSRLLVLYRLNKHKWYISQTSCSSFIFYQQYLLVMNIYVWIQFCDIIKHHFFVILHS